MSMQTDAGEEGGRSAVGRALVVGAGAAVAVGLAWAVLSVVVDIHLGLLVVAAVAGWAVGSAVGRTSPQVRHVRLVAVGWAVGAWVIGAVLSYVLSQVILPAAVTPLLERLSLAGLVAYTVGTFDLVRAASLAILVVAAWRSAR